MGERTGRLDVVVVASALEGLAMVNAGDVAPGMARLDGAAVAATSGEVDDLMWIGKVCCFLIGACERANDFDRAVQWCEEVQAFCKRWELQTLFSVCRTQYATVLLHRGTWDAAETELTSALAHFDESRRMIVGEGVAQLGRLRLRQGRLDEAASLFEQAATHPVSRLGRASLLHEDGDAAGAADLVEGMLRETPKTTPLARRGVLEHAVRIGLAAGNVELAERSALELRTGAETIASLSFRAAATLTSGMIAEHRGDLDSARADYERAAHCYHDGGQPYEEAHARLRLARLLEAGGLQARALAEGRAALDCFRQLGADRDREAAERFLDSMIERPNAAGPLSRRETDVLRLVAAGRTNKQIAEQLVISEHTVHRHVANILRKLDEPTRAAAAAHAARLDLI